ncbi:organic cation transporter protein-like isoform X2 [Apostichopus japonicus]
MTLEDIITTLGGFGCYQKRLFIVICVIEFFVPFQLFCHLFHTLPVDHWCNDTTWWPRSCPIHWNVTPSECRSFLKGIVIPTSGDPPVYSKCTKYDYENVTGDVTEWMTLNTSVDVIACDRGWVFEEDTPLTLSKEFELVCDKKALTKVAQSIYFAGILTGCLLCSFIGDRFGRLTIFYTGMLGVGVIGTIIAFVQSITSYLILRYITGLFIWFAVSSAYIILMEFIGTSHRVVGGTILTVPFGIGFMALAGIAYGIGNWRKLQLVVSLPYIAFLVFWRKSLESPRWLMTQERWQDVQKVLDKLAKLNKTDENLTGNEIDGLKESFHSQKTTSSLLHVLRIRRLRWRSLILLTIWFIHSFVYYGLTLNSANFGTNIYVTFCFFGLSEIPACILSLVLMKFIGRRYAVVTCMIPAGLACIFTTFLPPGGWMTTVAVLGKLWISSSFGSIYLFTVELFSTNLRVSVLGASSLSARIGGICAPLMLILTGIWKPLPLIVFGALSLAGGLLALLLPETRGEPMPQTVAEAESLGRTKIRLPTSPTDEDI